MSLNNRLAILLVLLSVVLTGCATNPVTGRSEISLVSDAQERAIGAQQYAPSQQSQGGEFVVDQALTGYVSRVGQRVAAVSDRNLDYEFVVLNNSVPNAWALPGGKIAVNRGLLTELNSEAELAAVLGHEVVHAAARHGAQAITRGTLLQGALMVGAIATSDNDYADYIVGASQLGAQLITQSYGREAEREADYYGIRYMLAAGYDPRAAVSLQQTFVRLSEGRNPGWIEGLFSSHPPSEERVANNQALVNLDAAIDMVPGEARFSGLKGDILLHQEKYRDAINAYDNAIRKHDDYYDYYLGRGVAYSRLGDRSQARNDLEHSAELLPTAIAMNELGKIALVQNDRQVAKQYFMEAAQAQGRVGQEATQSFVRLDLADNPQQYITVQPFNSDGRLFARVTNTSGMEVTNVTVDFAAVIGGSLGRQTRVINRLAGNSTVDVNSGLRFADGQAVTRDQMQAGVRSVQIP